MKAITTTAAAAFAALAPLTAQAGLAAPSMIAPTALSQHTGDVQPVFLDLSQVEADMLRLLRGNGGNSRGGNGGDSNGDNSRDGNGGDSNGSNSFGSNGGNSGSSNGGNSGGNGGDSNGGDS
jgi:hypothetical protein